MPEVDSWLQITVCRSDLVGRIVSKQARGTENQDQDQDGENQGFAPGTTTMWQPPPMRRWIERVRDQNGKRLNHANDQTPQHRAYNVTDTTKHGSSKGDQTN